MLTSCSLSRIHTNIAKTEHGHNAQTHAQTHKQTSILIFGAIVIEGITPALCCLAPNQTGFITFKASPEPTQSRGKGGKASVSQPHTLTKLTPPSCNKSLGTQKSVWKTQSSKANKLHVFSKWSTHI